MPRCVDGGRRPVGNVAARRVARSGFTMAEAVIALSVTALAGAALLASISSSALGLQDTLERTIAHGMAQQLLDDVAGMRYMAAGDNPRTTSMSHNSWEAAGPGWSRYNDIDDFHQVRVASATDRFGVALGTGDGSGGTRHESFRVPAGYFSAWRQEVDVRYVSDADVSTVLTGNNTSWRRQIQVRIYVNRPNGTRVLLAQAQRVVAYVPSP